MNATCKRRIFLYNSRQRFILPFIFTSSYTAFVCITLKLLMNEFIISNSWDKLFQDMSYITAGNISRLCVAQTGILYGICLPLYMCHAISTCIFYTHIVMVIQLHTLCCQHSSQSSKSLLIRSSSTCCVCLEK